MYAAHKDYNNNKRKIHLYTNHSKHYARMHTMCSIVSTKSISVIITDYLFETNTYTHFTFCYGAFDCCSFGLTAKLSRQCVYTFGDDTNVIATRLNINVCMRACKRERGRRIGMLDERVVMTVSIFCRCYFRFIGCWSCVHRCLLVRDKTGRPNIYVLTTSFVCPPKIMLNTPKT